LSKLRANDNAGRVLRRGQDIAPFCRRGAVYWQFTNFSLQRRVIPIASVAQRRDPGNEICRNLTNLG
jgi:hypothetical protein